jgi:hypothetical protein
VDFVPSPSSATVFEALDHLLGEKRSVSVAVAFVTRSGAESLRVLLERHPNIEDVHLVTRGAPITDPDALLLLKEDAGVSVSVVTGPEALGFHPKLWLLEGGDERLHVVSGSGNLTDGGLSRNREQFEVLTVTGEKVDAHWRRFAVLTEGAITLEEMLGSIAWREWKEQERRRAWLGREQQALDRRLSNSPAQNMEKAKDVLAGDLWHIHDQTVAEKLPHPDGGTYNPSGFRLEIEGHRGATDPVHIVGRLCRRQTSGFDVIKESSRWDLTVESLVVDPNKPYYEFFKGRLRELSEERLRQFPNWPGPPSA